MVIYKSFAKDIWLVCFGEWRHSPLFHLRVCSVQTFDRKREEKLRKVDESFTSEKREELNAEMGGWREETPEAQFVLNSNPDYIKEVIR